MSALVSGHLTKSPCVDVCKFDKHKHCKACGRTKAEKKHWKDLAAAEKHAIWERILRTHASGRGKKARLLRERYERVSRSARHRQRD